LHVIELASELALTNQQLARVRALFDAMKGETVPIGERLIAQEAELDRLFATRIIMPVSLAASIKASGSTKAALWPPT
jgi:hypothetical protein